MFLHPEQLEQLTQLAISAALAAGRIVQAGLLTPVEVHHKGGNGSTASQVVTEVDHQAQAAIVEMLEPTCSRYGLALLAEESSDDGQRLKRRAFWSIDPLDGTLSFIERVPGFAVSIGLVARDGTPLVGVAYDPLEEVVYHAWQGGGAWRNGQPICIPPLDPARPLVLQTDRSFRSDPRLESTRAGLEQLANQLGLNGADIRFRTGGVMNACDILADANACYFKYPRPGNSGGSLWDYASTACMFSELNAFASDIYGQPMDLNRADSTFMNHRGLLFAADVGVVQGVMALVEKLGKQLPSR